MLLQKACYLCNKNDYQWNIGYWQHCYHMLALLAAYGMVINEILATYGLVINEILATCEMVINKILATRGMVTNEIFIYIWNGYQWNIGYILKVTYGMVTYGMVTNEILTTYGMVTKEILTT